MCGNCRCVRSHRRSVRRHTSRPGCRRADGSLRSSREECYRGAVPWMMDEFASAVRIFHSRGALEKGSNRRRGYSTLAAANQAYNKLPEVAEKLTCGADMKLFVRFILIAALLG